MKRLASALLWLALLTPAPAAAAAPLPLDPPPPDLAPLLPFAAAPLEKPPVLTSAAPLPPPPVDLPPLPLAPLLLPAADKPIAFLAQPRTLPCVGAWLGIPSESLECGRARFSRGEYEEAARALEQAVRGGTERELLIEARYWLAETFYRLGRTAQADWLFRQVAQESRRHELGVFSLHGSGFTALRLLDPVRARETFTQLLAGPLPSPLDVWSRYGLGLASYALGRHADAQAAFAALAQRGVPEALARDLAFWRGEALGRVGQHDRAAVELHAFTQGPAHALREAGLARLGWWSLAAGRTAEAATAFRAYLAPAPAARTVGAAPERDWAEAGLAQALLADGDREAALRVARALQARRSPLALPVQLRLIRAAVEAARADDARALIQELLSASLAPGVRAWVLLVNGEAQRAEGNRDEARTQYDLARSAEPGTPTGWEAAVRLALTNFEMREFAQAAAGLQPVLGAPIPPELRARALLLQGEAAYYAGDFGLAAAAFRRVLVEFPDHPQSAGARLAVAWTALRQQRAEEARREFVEFARAVPEHAHAIDAVLLAAELALAAGDQGGARQLLERMLSAYPSHPRSDFARLNHAVLLVRAGDAAGAAKGLRDWIARAPFPPLLGRAHAALGVALLVAGRHADATQEFTRAQREGLGALAALGLGVSALAGAQWEAATRALVEARDTGTAAVAAAAEYGLAAVAFHQGKPQELKQLATAALAGAPRGPTAPRLLYVLAGVAVEARDWPGALAAAKRLVTEFPADVVADDALERVGAGAVGAAAWPVAHEAYTLLRQRYPQSPFVEASRVAFAEAQLETGKAADARADLEQFVVTSPADPRAARAWIALARAREATGERPGALEAYARAARETQGVEWTPSALLGHARLLADERRWGQARTILERVLKSDDRAAVVEAAHGIGHGYGAEGDHLAAAEYYMTAAYLAPESPVGRRALLAAAWSFGALKQPEAAAITYRKLLAQRDLPADLLEAARRALKELGR